MHRKLIGLLVVVAALATAAIAAGIAGATNSTPSVAANSPGAFDVVGNVKHKLVLNTAVLARYPSKTLTVTYKSGAATETHTFTGPLLRDVIADAGPQFDPAIKNDKLGHYVSATGSDGYKAIVAWGELDADFGNQDILLAVTQDGASLADEGPRLVVPGDARGGRYVSGVVRLRLDRGR